MHDAFISYARSDAKQLAQRITDALEAAGKDVFVDLDDIPPASAWQRDLRDGVANSSAFLYVISPGSIASEHCRLELDHAREANKRIIPIVGAPVPDAHVPVAVAALNWVPQQGVFADEFDASLAKLIAAIETDLDATRAHTRWQARAEAWRDADRDSGLLATGAELRAADEWLAAAAGRQPEPTAVQAEWIAAGRAAAQRRQRRLFAAAVAALAVTLILGVLAVLARNEAVEQREIARSDELSSDAVANLSSDPELGLMLALEATRTRESQRTVQTLRRALLASHVRTTVRSEEGVPVDGVALSPDGELLATALEDGTAALWDSNTGEPVSILPTGAGFVSEVVFTPDGGSVLTFDSGGSVRTWSTGEGAELSEFRASSGSLISGAVSPDGKLVAAGDGEGRAVVFNRDGSDARRLPGIGGRIGMLEFSPDSRSVLVAAEHGGARIFDAVNGELTQVLGEGAPASAAGFDSGGRTVAVVGIDGSAELFDARTGERRGRPLQQPGRGAFVTSVAFVPGQDVVLTAGNGGEVAAWDAATGGRIAEYRGHQGLVLDVSAGADGRRLATAGGDGTARVWDLGQRSAAVKSAAPSSPQFTADGSRLLYADGLARVVDPASGRQLDEILARTPIYATQLSPDGERIAAALGDGRIHFYDFETGDEVGTPLDHGTGDLFAVEWSADGSRLMSAGRESGLKVWDAEGGNALLELGVPSGGGFLIDAALSPDGEQVAVAESALEVDLSRRVVLRAVAGGDVIRELTGHTDRLESVDFDPSGARLVTAAADNTARIWDVATGVQSTLLNNDGFPLRQAVFSPDGSLVATSSASGELRVWAAESGLELVRLTGGDGEVAISPDGDTVAAADNYAGQLTVFECDVCAVAADQLERLAQERITREPTSQERELYLDR